MESIYTYYLQFLFLFLVIINHAFEIYLCKRQIKAIRNQSPDIPQKILSFFSSEDLSKAKSYSEFKLIFFQVHHIWKAILLFLWFPFNGLNSLYHFIPLQGIHKEVALFCSFLFIQSILDLPWSIYMTFVVEKKFGFNKMNFKTFIKDRLIGFFIIFAIGLPLLYLIFFLFLTFNDWWWLLTFFSIAIFQLFLVWIYPIIIAPMFNKFTPLEEPNLKAGIEGLLRNARFQSNGVFIMDASKRSSHGNAYFTGLGKNKRIVFFDTLIKDLFPEEILAILAHEIGHMKLKHIPKSLSINLVLSFIGFWIMGQTYDKNWFFKGHFLNTSSPSLLFIIFTLAVPIYLFWFKPIGSWFSRRNEFEADKYAAKETHPSRLIDALIKLYKQNASSLNTDRIYSLFYNSHPPAIERIKKLSNYELKMKHDGSKDENPRII